MCWDCVHFFQSKSLRDVRKALSFQSPPTTSGRTGHAGTGNHLLTSRANNNNVNGQRTSRPTSARTVNGQRQQSRPTSARTSNGQLSRPTSARTVNNAINAQQQSSSRPTSAATRTANNGGVKRLSPPKSPAQKILNRIRSVSVGEESAPPKSVFVP